MALSLAPVSSGCDGNLPVRLADAAAPAPDAADPLTDFGSAVARATCEALDRCCSPTERGRVLGIGDSYDSCVTSLESFYGFQYRTTLSLVAMARVAFDPDKMARCLATYRAASCTAPGLTAASACRGVFTGTVDNGGACQGSFECTSRLCVNNPASDGNQCSARKRDGQACMTGAECQSGVCQSAFLGGSCTSNPADASGCGGGGFWITF